MHQTKMWIINKYTDNDEEEDHDESTSQSILTENTPQEQVPEKSSKWSYWNYNDNNMMQLLR